MRILLFFVFLAGLANAGTASAADRFKVLVVMSYEEDNPWVKDISEGIGRVLGDTSDVTTFHLNTKLNRPGGPEKAREAHELFQRLKPDGVIAADDDAQEMFVVPYLRDQVRTPVMFCGVNAAAEKYGYPSSNVSGILERAHARESLSFIKQMLPNIRSVCFLTHNVPAGLALRAQVEAEKGTYPAKVAAFHLVGTLGELEGLAGGLRKDCDALLVDSLEGVLDSDSRPMRGADVIGVIRGLYDGPLLGGNRYQVEQGAWAAVVKTGKEQGETSADMLLKAMRGMPVADIPVTRNGKGQRIINVTAIESRKISLRPIILKGATLIRQQP
ncbi:MAG: ABC transporter substrate-binding protein [Alphaproteobacteria bacterium]|nr:ABC transporter substrate-binding protein [Alphaproteobacteria bacterium]